MSTVQLALYRPHRWRDLGGRLVCWWTKSPYSHCELVVDGWCYSSSILDGGVRRKRVDLSRPYWTLIDLPAERAEDVLDWFERTKGTRYGWFDLFAQQVLRLPLSDTRGWFCSEWCAQALALPRPEVWHPGMLAEYAQLRVV